MSEVQMACLRPFFPKSHLSAGTDPFIISAPVAMMQATAPQIRLRMCQNPLGWAIFIADFLVGGYLQRQIARPRA